MSILSIFHEFTSETVTIKMFMLYPMSIFDIPSIVILTTL